jgi:hypothetical protein
MHDEEQNKVGREQEMHGARRLSAMEQRQEPREGRIDRRRHRQSGEDKDRKGDHDAEIRELLQRVVMQRLVA